MIEFLSILLGAQKSKMDQRGASAVEYGLLVALIAVAIIAAVVLLSGSISGIFTKASSSIK
ncbi:Flp family type IVb pilin [Nocardioides sp. ChNu-153]|uniref:Flp family type IVb pilin n=1 Tax=unclassified Nocardioides TaxID=2615069 RepID=UPI002407501C|nr:MULTISPECIES: Flp family type IVb pilin [unclassified Nocardioides]MDF9715917.1 Flp family type IVb pilin [Nocardioides sp. ChNu-99]MDN7122910.1 Flp family type IVb pilin [Nocardioides sp. ChNu-153]